MTVGRELDIQAHLDRVSRSFAFCIARLEEPLREQIGLSYLLCRLLDTVEDSRWREEGSGFQQTSFTGFIDLLSDLSNPDLRVRVRAWSDFLYAKTDGLSDSEVALLRESDLIFSRISRLSLAVRSVIAPPVLSMARGMRGYSRMRGRNQGRLVLRTLHDVNHYCFFVAGVVGEILDGLLRLEARRQDISVATQLIEGVRFGLFLQKVNVLKDRENDLSEGRDLVPVVADVFHSAITDAEHAFRYLSAIPDAFRSYRLFCAWSLFLGLASLPHIARAEKIGRVETSALLIKIEFAIDSPERLNAYFREKLEIAKRAVPFRVEADQSSVETSFLSKEVENERLALYREFYVGAARDEDLLELAAR